MLQDLAAHPDGVLALAVGFLAVVIALTTAVNGRPGRTQCGAPTRRGGGCRNPVRPGRPCRAGHPATWQNGQYATVVVLLLGAIAIVVMQPLGTALA
ncbi:hypothetical protein [Microbacterium album]|uniref:hypothetical protein n=1 Tax=Microbacterium album TaxID=2053191 RepID=UPI001663BCCB|nr:hypothetical protein [Microbacterium album]